VPITCTRNPRREPAVWCSGRPRSSPSTLDASTCLRRRARAFLRTMQIRDRSRATRVERQAFTANSRQIPGTPLSSCSPRPANSRPDPATRSTTVRDTSTSPGSANPDTRAPMLTAMPPTPSFLSSISPVWTPLRTTTPSVRAASPIARAHLIARASPSKVAKKSSPRVSTSVRDSPRAGCARRRESGPAGHRRHCHRVWQCAQ
jgi:hypothetical protein